MRAKSWTEYLSARIQLITDWAIVLGLILGSGWAVKFLLFGG